MEPLRGAWLKEVRTGTVGVGLVSHLLRPALLPDLLCYEGPLMAVHITINPAMPSLREGLGPLKL